jgi:Glycosyltransferase family 87
VSPLREILARYVAAFRVIRAPVFLGFVPVFVLVWALVLMIQGDDVAVDFHHELYPHANLLLEWENPYPPPDSDLSDGTNHIWPIAAAALAAPLALLPAGVADGLMTVVVIVCFFAALLVMGVRDWRVFGAAALWPSFISAMQTANLTLPLCLLAALVWRYRDRRWIAGAALGTALSLKFFLWPLLVWLAALRRWHAAALAVAVAAASLLLILPFESLVDYARLLRNLSDTFDGKSYTPYAFLVEVGLPDGLAKLANYALGAALLLLAWRRKSFALAIGAALVLSPIVWLHFFAVLALPLAIASPRFSWPWLLPLLMIVAPGTENGDPWQSALVLVLAALVLAVSERLLPVRNRERAAGAGLLDGSSEAAA